MFHEEWGWIVDFFVSNTSFSSVTDLALVGKCYIVTVLSHLNRGACKVSCASIHAKTKVKSLGVSFPDQLDGMHLHEDYPVGGVADCDHILLTPLSLIWDGLFYSGFGITSPCPVSSSEISWVNVINPSSVSLSAIFWGKGCLLVQVPLILTWLCLND